MNKANDPTIALLLRLLNTSYKGSAWHGTTLSGALRGVNPEMAAWRPQPTRHNIWELVVHAAFWKYRVYLRLTDEPPRSFEEKGSNWFVRPVQMTDKSWTSDKELLKTWHNSLYEAVGQFNSANLMKHPGKSKHTFEDFIIGAASHDTYHTGQIQLLKKLWEDQ